MTRLEECRQAPWGDSGTLKQKRSMFSHVLFLCCLHNCPRMQYPVSSQMKCCVCRKRFFSRKISKQNRTNWFSLIFIFISTKRIVIIYSFLLTSFFYNLSGRKKIHRPTVVRSNYRELTLDFGLIWRSQYKCPI